MDLHRRAVRRLLRTPVAYRIRPVRSAERGVLLLHSIPKSGTNMVRLWVANYVAWIAGKREPISYEQMAERFPNVRDRLINRVARRRPGHPSISAVGYDDFWYTHSTVILGSSPASTLLHVYRNPFDQIVSAWHYFESGRGTGVPLDAAYAARMAGRCDVYLVCRPVVRVSYEELWRNPHTGFARLVPCQATFARFTSSRRVWS